MRIVALALILMSISVTPLHPDALTPAEEVRRLLDDGRLYEAETAARRLLAASEAATGPASLETALALDLLVEALNLDGNAVGAEGLTLARRALETRRSLAGEDDPSTAAPLFNLGVAERLAGNYPAARADLARAVELREHAGTVPDLLLVDVLIEMGYEATLVSDFEGATARLDRAARLAEMSPGTGDARLARALHRRGVVAYRQDDLRLARGFCDRALTIRRRILRPDHLELAESIGFLALLDSTAGDYASARPLYEDALDRLTRSFGPDSLRLGSAHYNLALFLMEIGDYAGARPHMQKSYDLIVQAVGPNHPDASSSGHGRLLMEMGDYPSARTALERSLRLRESFFGPTADVTGYSAQALGELLLLMGDLDRARTDLERARSIFETNHGAESPLVASALVSLALVDEARSRNGESEALLDQAHRVYATTLGPEHPKTATALGHLARLRWRIGERGRSLDDAFGAIRALRSSLVRTARALPERTALGYAATLHALFDLPCTLVAGGATTATVTTAWDAVVRSRALVLDELAARHRTVLEHESGEVARLAANLSDARGTLARFMSSEGDAADGKAYQARLLTLIEAKDRAESALADRSAVYRGELAVRDVGLAGVVAALPPRTALVAFVRYRDLAAGAPAYLAFARAASTGRITAIPLGPASAIEDRIRRWHDEAAAPPVDADAEARYRAAAIEVRRAVWDRLVPRLGQADQVFVVPDGAIALLNFATLPTDDGRYLVEGALRIHLLSSERDVAALNARLPTGRGLLLVGAPDFNAGGAILADAATESKESEAVPERQGLRSSCGQFRSLRFGPLPGAAAETGEIAALWRARTPGAGAPEEPALELTGAGATEAAFRREAPTRRILHIATHGFFVQDRCDSLLDHPDEGWLVPAERQNRVIATLESPFLLSGLAFAGANQRETQAARGEGDDGILTAEEIASLDLRGVEWALLSACGTGVGPSQSGEGVLGLRRTFQVAGARTVVMSLWDVDDHTTREWMRRLYENRFKGRSTVESVRAASQALLAERRASGVTTHPSAWGAFVAAGDWR
ncbi:MAG TPA: CHAT domain-containing tetratricopeptide repeat protein [Dongiaceae bacterium]|nr:CHAT domain-containing tetratricopeptide repeat protein [Dongiaceae bacterium]